MTAESKCVILVIGQTGAGKSEFGNGYLKDNTAFKADDSPDAVTFLTSAKERMIDGNKRICIDTQGLDDTQGVDAAHVQQMIRFLREWQKGVNAIAIIINGQAPRFNAGTQKIIKVIHNFFNNPHFWNHVCLIFTKNYKDHPINRRQVEDEYQRKVKEVVSECIGEGGFKQLFPVFLVDSKDINETSTKNELAAFHAWAVGLPSLPTQNVIAPDVNFMRIEEEKRYDILVSENIVQINDVSRCKTLVYENQRREKKTSYNGIITYSDWERVGESKIVSQYEKTEIEYNRRVLVNETKNPIYRTEHGDRRYGLFGPRSTYQVFDHNDIYRTYQDKKRRKVTNFDGSENYGEWEVTNT
jgi:GTPase SAR1 family protein